MKVKEIYDLLGGNYDETLSRMLKEERMAKYLLKFTEADDYSNLLKALEEKKWEDVFRFSHNIKGVSMNLGLTKLIKSASEFCDIFRSGNPVKEYDKEFETLCNDYKETINIINEHRNELTN